LGTEKAQVPLPLSTATIFMHLPMESLPRQATLNAGLPGLARSSPRPPPLAHCHYLGRRPCTSQLGAKASLLFPGELWNISFLPTISIFLSRVSRPAAPI
jgi:hypothetical protein